MRTRIVLAAAVAGLTAATFGPAFAAQPPLPKPTVTVDSDGSDGTVGVYTGVEGQPLVGARVNTDSGTVCVGFSYQVPQCVDVGNDS